ncbi:hypothetical protein [Thermogemmatispora carboxidivorans]|uniref:hypothetical protein n=1 Tax=Thermogemmatispora carboxidivorans TaxID=1382306 RepID=UPI00069B653D|nr:hypothetical protein [Thermogemmatispora carboxidivorans]
MTGILLLLFLILLIALLGVAAFLWGADSRDGPGSPEWQRRGSWFLPIDHARPVRYSTRERYIYLYRRQCHDERTS